MVRCRNCGHINDGDATFCETCGSDLTTTISSRTTLGESIKREESMDKSTKILIIVVVILVAGLGVAGGFIIQSNLASTKENVLINQTNASTNNSTPSQTTNQTTPTHSSFIGSQKAIEIAKIQIESDPSNVYYANFVNGTPYNSPYYYAVYAMHQSEGGWSYEPTEVDVNAKTGKIIATYQAGGTNDPLVPD